MKRKTMFERFFPRKAERGQAIVLIAGGMIALLAMVGLMIDGGMIFIQYSRLKRAVDSAAVSAALQFREGYTINELEDAAGEFLQLNQVDSYNVSVEVCSDWEHPTDPELCTNPPRKLVRVVASTDVDFAFLPVIGIDKMTITTKAIGEAASVDAVLVIDRSMSMSSEGGGDPNRLDDPADDPAQCNPANSCHPFAEIKQVAKEFIQTLYFPYDRVAIVTFDTTAHLDLQLLHNLPDLRNYENIALGAVDALTVFEPPECNGPNPAAGPCRNYDASHNFIGADCPHYRNTSPNDPTSCTSSNIGSGLLMAGNEFARPPIREDSLWVVILLAGGPANATDPDVGHPYGYCPASTWNLPFCRDDLASVRHSNGDLDYDGDDYARDMADFVADPVHGQGAVIYAIGLGNPVRNAPTRTPGGDPDVGEKLLQYAALEAGDDTNTPQTYFANHGIYYYAPGASQLREIFRSIAQNIATRLSR